MTDDRERRARLDAQDAAIGDAGRQVTNLGDATLAKGLTALRADARLTPSQDDPPASAADVAGKSDDELVALALATVSLSSEALASVLTIPELPRAFATTTADVGRYWSAPADMPLGRRIHLGGALASRNPAAAPLAEALITRSKATIARYGEEAGAWIRSHVPATKLPYAVQHLTVALTDLTSPVNVALNRGTPVEARAGFLALARAAGRGARAATPRRS